MATTSKKQIVPVSMIAKLLGENKYRTQEQALADLRRPKRKHPVYDSVRKLLRKTRFYKKFCEADTVTFSMKQRSAKLVDRACKLANLHYNKPYAYFQKQRGIYLEKQNTKRAAERCETTLTGVQKTVTREFPAFSVMGQIDGEDETHVYEIKTRTQVLNVLPWEKIQVYWYSVLTGKPGRLVHFLGDKHDIWECTLKEATEHVEKHVKILTEIL